jgi:hypothetical protein
MQLKEKNMAALISAAWTRAMTPANIVSSFSNTGIYPLNVVVLQDALIGSQPKSDNLRHHTLFCCPDLALTDREMRKIQRQGLDVDAIHAVYAGLQLFERVSPVKAKPEPSARTFVEGGALMTTPEMREMLQMKLEDKHSKAREIWDRKKLANEVRVLKREETEQKKQSRQIKRLERLEQDSRRKTKKIRASKAPVLENQCVV